MAYKFQLGKHKLASGASIDTTVGDIELGDNQVDNSDITSVDANKLRSIGKPNILLTYSAKPNNNDTLKFEFDGDDYEITFKSSGNSDLAFTVSGVDRTADILIGATDDITFESVAVLINSEAESLAAVRDAGGNTLSIDSLRPGVDFAEPGGATQNTAASDHAWCTSIAKSSPTIKFAKLENGGITERTASDMRTDLGLAIGTNVQAQDAGLASIAGLTTAANKLIYTTASDTYAVADLTAAGRALLDDADAAAQRTTLGLAIGSDVQAFDAQLADIAGLTPSDGNIVIGDGSNFILESGGTARTSLGLAIGSDVQAHDAQLDEIAALAVTNGGFIVGDGSAYVLESGATARTSLGLGSVATLDSIDEDNMASNSATRIPTQQSVKAYVDSVAQGLDVKDSVVTAVSANVGGSLATGLENGDTVNGIAVATGDRILLRAQTTASENGIYIVAASGAPARAADMAANADAAGNFVFVEGGADAGKGFVCTAGHGTAVVGTNNLPFSLFSSSGAFGGGTNISLNGSNFDLDDTIENMVEVTGNSLVVGSTDKHNKMAVDNSNDKLVFSAANAAVMEIGANSLSMAAGLIKRKMTVVSADAAGSTITAASGEVHVVKFGASNVNQGYTLTLPSPSGLAGAVFKIKRVETAPNTHDLTIARAGSEKIDGTAANIVLDGDTPDGALSLMCDGTDWYIM